MHVKQEEQSFELDDGFFYFYRGVIYLRWCVFFKNSQGASERSWIQQQSLPGQLAKIMKEAIQGCGWRQLWHEAREKQKRRPI